MEVGKSSVLKNFIGANNSTQFVIPTYQRNYVWEKKQILKLLDDISNMFQYLNAETKFHYIGTIVYIDTNNKGFFSEKTIIDGQQRITTLFLILQAIKYICQENGDYARAIAISKKYLENDEDIITVDNEMLKFRLKPLINDDDVYEKIASNKIEELDNDAKKSRVYNAFNIIKSRVVNWLQEYDVDTVLKVMDKLRFVWIQLDKNENPQQIFESINSTGLPLLSADLIRNYILMNKDNETQTKFYEEYWVPIESKYVQTEKLAEFFRFYISIKEKKTISLKDVYESFKTNYKEMKKTRTEEEILTEIKDYAKYYYYITNNCYEYPEIEEALLDYRNIKSNMPHILIMETMSLYFQNIIMKSDLINTIKIIVVYIVRRSICGEDTKSISNIFGLLVGKIMKDFDGNNYYESVIKNLVIDTRANSQYMPTDTKVIDEFKNSNLYVRDLVSFILKKIENNNNNIPYDNLSIEHIMPQTSTDYWKEYIENIEEYDDIVNHIGNLTLVSHKDNSGMSNRNFEVKKEYLNNTKHIKLNEYIVSKDIWNEDEINNRSEYLAKEFISIFKYPKIYEIDNTKNIYQNELDLFEDDIEIISKLKPIKVSINNIINDVINWTDVYKLCIKSLFEANDIQFKKACTKLHENTYDKMQISNNPNDLRSPYLFANNLYCETNKSTKDKILLLRRIYQLMNITIKINIIF